MNTDSQHTYRKHIYWLTRAEELRVREELEGRDIEMGTAERIVCAPLNEGCRISSVSPEVWDFTCARQGSWYRASDKNGLYLIISSFELNGYDARKAATITRSSFDPPVRAKPEEKTAMVHDPELESLIPPRWRAVSDVEKRVYLRWARRLGSRVENFDSLYLTHTANHANFMKPRFYIKAAKAIIPYSIDQSANLCSCCLELFQVIGSRFRKKLIAPCPGATIFARLKPDHYLLAES